MGVLGVFFAKSKKHTGQLLGGAYSLHHHDPDACSVLQWTPHHRYALPYCACLLPERLRGFIGRALCRSENRACASPISHVCKYISSEEMGKLLEVATIAPISPCSGSRRLKHKPQAMPGQACRKLWSGWKVRDR